MKKLFAVCVLVIAILVITNFPSHGADNVIYGCYDKHGGDLRIVSNRSHCKKNEVPISWNQVGPQGPKGDTGAKGDQGLQGPPGGIKVYDANKQFLGYLLGGTLSSNAIFVPQLEIIVNFILCCTKTGIGDIAWTQVFFESADCTGELYTQPQYSNIIFKYQDKIYIGERIPPALISWNSSAVFNSAIPWQCTPNIFGPSLQLLVPAKEFTSELPFSIPVSLPLEMTIK